MATLDRNFESFHSRIALDQGRIDRIKSAHIALRKYVEADAPLSRVLKEVFLQGSYAQSTAVRPPSNGKFDVDVMLALDVRKSDPWWGLQRQSPSEALDWVADRLRQVPAYVGKVRRKGRCVRIEYAGEFHMDVVPAHAPNGTEHGVEVPNRELAEWHDSNPKGYLDWCARVSKASDGRFTRVTKYLKWWRDHRLPEQARPKSIILQTMIGRAMTTPQRSDAHAVVHALDYIVDRFDSMVLPFGAPLVENPSLPDEDLATRWDSIAATRFREHVTRARVHARAALGQVDTNRSAKDWTEIFGDAFPLGV